MNGDKFFVIFEKTRTRMCEQQLCVQFLAKMARGSETAYEKTPPGSTCPPPVRRKMPLRRGVGAALPPAGSGADGRGLPSHGRAAARKGCAWKIYNKEDFTDRDGLDF